MTEAQHAENVLLKHFKPWAIQYVSQASTGTIMVQMYHPVAVARETIMHARQYLKEAGFDDVKVTS